MLQHRRNLLTSRIISGSSIYKFSGVVYIIKPPSKLVQCLAEEKYYEIERECRFRGFFTNEQALYTLIKEGVWTIDSDSNVKEINKRMDDLKSDLYKQALNPNLVDKTRKLLRRVEAKYESMMMARHSLDYITVSGYANFVKQRFLLSNTLYNQGGDLIYESYEYSNPLLLDRLLMSMAVNKPKLGEYRDVSRNDPWRSIWSSNDSIFANEILTDEQQTLVMFTKMYENAQQHPDCPPDKIMRDDDMFDGWLITNRRKGDKERMDAYLEKHGMAAKVNKVRDKISGSQEVFIPVETQQEANEVNDMNDFQNKMIKKQRAAVVKKHGTVHEGNLPDQKINLQRQANEMFKKPKG